MLTPRTGSLDNQLLSSAPSATCANHTITPECTTVHNGQLYLKRLMSRCFTCLHYKSFTLQCYVMYIQINVPGRRALLFVGMKWRKKECALLRFLLVRMKYAKIKCFILICFKDIVFGHKMIQWAHDKRTDRNGFNSTILHVGIDKAQRDRRRSIGHYLVHSLCIQGFTSSSWYTWYMSLFTLSIITAAANLTRQANNSL